MYKTDGTTSISRKREPSDTVIHLAPESSIFAAGNAARITEQHLERSVVISEITLLLLGAKVDAATP